MLMKEEVDGLRSVWESNSVVGRLVAEIDRLWKIENAARYHLDNCINCPDWCGQEPGKLCEGCTTGKELKTALSPSL